MSIQLNFRNKKSELSDVVLVHWSWVNYLRVSFYPLTNAVMYQQLNYFMRNVSIFGLKKVIEMIWHQCIDWWVKSALLSVITPLLTNAVMSHYFILFYFYRKQKLLIDRRNIRDATLSEPKFSNIYSVQKS